MWHGTSKTDPIQVYTKDGINIAYANDGCLWGRGNYFAVNANYSCPSYSYRVPTMKNTFEVFCAKVIIGKPKDFGVQT